MSNKIKVLHIITRLDKGGSAENTFLTLKGMDRTRFDVALISGPVEDPTQDRRQHIEEMGIKHLYIPELVRNINLIKDCKALLKIYRYLKKEKYEIVHTHTSKTGLLGRIAAKLAGTPIIIHTPHGHVFFGYFGPLKTKFFISLEKFGSLITDKIIALTNREKNDTFAFKVAKEDKLTVIHSGIELKKFTESSPQDIRLLKNILEIPENALIVGTAGRLVPIKGPEYLVKAAEKVLQIQKNVFFLFTGDGYLKEDLAKLAQDLGIKKNIMFLGWKDKAAEIISLYDIFVLPSLNEGMGRVLVEAMALGKPIVASNIGGIPDLISHGKNGFLVPPQKPDKLAQYIQLLLEDENKRTKMGQEGKKLAQNFSTEKMVKKIESLYNHQLKIKEITTPPQST